MKVKMTQRQTQPTMITLIKILAVYVIDFHYSEFAAGHQTKRTPLSEINCGEFQM